MGTIVKSSQNRIGKALLSIYEVKDVMREDQKLFHRALSALKKKVGSTSNELEDHSLGSGGQKIN